MQEGFWLFADMTKDGYPKSWDGSYQPLEMEKEHDFLKEQVDTEITVSCFSKSFGVELLPGMYSPPVCVYQNQTQKHCVLVVNHSSGDYSPNLMIMQ